MNVILQLDANATAFIYSFLPHNTFFDLLFSFFSQRGLSVAIWTAIVLFLLLFEERRDKRFIFYLLLSVAFSTFLSLVVLKNIFKRPRPYTQTPYKIVIVSCPNDYSFPSGHATVAFASATILWVFDKKRRFFYVFIAGLIGLSRIYLQCHYLFDVITGGIIGSLSSIGTLHLLHFRKTKRGQ